MHAHRTVKILGNRGFVGCAEVSAPLEGKPLLFEQGGRLVPDYGWGEALTDLVTDGPARAALAERAAAWGRTQTVTSNVGEWEAVFAEAATRAGRTVSVPRADGDAPALVGATAGPRGRTIIPRPIPQADAPASSGAGDGARSAPRRGLFRRRAGR